MKRRVKNEKPKRSPESVRAGFAVHDLAMREAPGKRERLRRIFYEHCDRLFGETETLERVAASAKRLRRRPKLNVGPGYNEQREHGFGRVEKPTDTEGDERRPPKPGEVEVASINLRETPLYWMWSRKMIDDVQLYAGERYRQSWEALRPYAIVADMGRTIVDFSYRPDAGMVESLDAAAVLVAADEKIGHKDAEMLRMICGVGYTLKDVAFAWYGIKEGRRLEECQKYLGQRCRDALESLVEHWNIKRKSPRNRFHRSFGALTANPDDWSYDPAVAKQQRKSARRARRR